jgi:hypothetical protein
LLVWHSYTGSFLVTFSCIYVLQPKLVHLLYFSYFYLMLLLVVFSTDLKILYSFLYEEYINHIHLLKFLLLLSPFRVWPSLSMTSYHNIAAFVLRLYSTVERKHVAFGFLSLANFT